MFASLCLLAATADVHAEHQVILVSNTGQADSGSGSLATNDFAQAFTTGRNPGGYVVTHLKARLSGTTAITATSNLMVTIQTSSAAGRPDTVVGTLSNPATLGGAAGNGADFTFTAPGDGIELAPSTTYFIVFDLSDSGLALELRHTNSHAEDDIHFGWVIADDSLDRNIGATSWSPHHATRMVTLVGYGRGPFSISGPEAHRIRQQVCPNDMISTETHYSIFREQIVVGRVRSTDEYGWDHATRTGLMITVEDGFGSQIPRPPYRETLSQEYAIAKITAENGKVRLALDKALTADDRRVLVLRVCSKTLRFDAADESVGARITTYTWNSVDNAVGSDLNWSRLHLLSLYTGRQGLDQFVSILSYGRVDVSLGVARNRAAPRVKRAQVNGRSLTLTFDKSLDMTKTPAADAFSVSVRPIAQIASVPSFVTPVPTHTTTRTVSNVQVSGSTVRLTLNASPPQFRGNFSPGLLIAYTPPSTNALTGSNGTGVYAFTDRFVGDSTPKGGGTLVVTSDATESPPPEITGAPALSAAPRTDGTWTSGDTVEATLTFTEAVVVDTSGGTPSVTLRLGGTTAKSAGYLRGSGTTALVFGYTLTDDDGSHNSMALDSDSLALNGGTIRSQSTGFDALLAHYGTTTVPLLPLMGTAPTSRSMDGSEAEGTTVTTAEDTAYTFRPSDFGFSDDAKRDRNSHVKIVTLPEAGALTVDGSAARQNQIVDKTDIGPGALVFTPAANAYGDPYTSFDFRASDDGLTEGAAETLTIDVTPENDDPEGTPSIAGEVEGEAMVGQTVTVTTSRLSDPDGMTNPGWSYRWLRVVGTVETAIDGATSNTYVLDAADAGNRIKVEVSYTDDGGKRETVPSAAWPSQGSIAAAPQAVESNAADAGGLTATFRNAPGTHDGAREFTVELHFSAEPQGLSYKTVQGSLLEATNATVRGARRLVRGSNLGWEIRVRPDAAGDISLTLPVRPCSAANAICVDGAALDAAATATIAYAAPQVTQTPLTAQFKGMPAGHDGGAFTFELALSEDVRGLSYKTVRDSALSVTGGTVAGARRLVRGENRRWEVRVSPGGLGDVSIALAATQDCSASGAICTPEGRKQSTSTSAAVPGPALSVADGSVEEGSGAALAFTVTLSHAAAGSVSVDYATADGTATAGSDYTATSGTLTFAARETSKTVRVPVLDDAHDEGSETLTLTLSDPRPSSVKLADANATGTIENSDPMPKAWLAHFGRTVGSQVLEAVTERTHGGSSGSHLNVGGVSLGGGTPFADDAEPLAPQDWLTRQLAEGPDAWRPQERTLTERDLLLGSSFHLVSQADEDRGAVWSAWGRVSTGSFQAEVDGAAMDGDVVTGLLGFDAKWKRVLAGLLLAHSEGDGAYSLSDGSDPGSMASTLTGVYPYARLRLGGRLSVWGLAGIGSGDLRLMRKDETIDTDLEMRLGAMGVRGTLLEGIGGYDLAVKSDVLWVDTDSDAAAGLAATSARVSRLRLILEGGRTVTLASGSVLAPTLQVGLRHDGGDAETGTGVEVGAGLRYGAGILSVEGQVRTLLAHEAGSYEEWGASGSIRLSPNASGLGPSLAVLPSWGAAGSGVERLWSQPDASALVQDGAAPTAAGRVDAELGWGLPALRGRGVLTPYARLALAAGDGQSWHLGTRLALPESLDLSLEGSHRQTGGSTAHDLTLRATLPW